MTPEVQKLLAQLEPELRQAFMEAWERVTSQAQKALLEDAIARGAFDEAVAILRLDPVILAALDRAFDQGVYRGGVATLAALGTLKDPFLVGVWLSALTVDTRAPKPSAEPTPET